MRGSATKTTSGKPERFDVELLRDLLDYNADIGRLTWKARQPSHFLNCKRDPAWACGIWNAKYAGKPAFSTQRHGYVAGSVFGVHVYAHQVAFAIMTGRWAEGQIDHINGKRDDNRWDNLRPVAPAENARNTAISSVNTSGVVGVSWNREKRRWWAYIYPEKGQRKLLGSFRHKADAIVARKNAERTYGYHENHGRRPAA